MNKCVNYFWLVFESILENISYKYMGLKKLALDFKSLLSNLNCIDNEGTFKSIIIEREEFRIIFSFRSLLIRLNKSWCVWLSGYWIADSTSSFSPIKTNHHILEVYNDNRIL